MKKGEFLFSSVMLAALTLSACSKDQAGDPTVNNSDAQPDAAYVSVALDFSNAGGKARAEQEGYQGTDAGSAEESNISVVRAIFFGSDKNNSELSEPIQPESLKVVKVIDWSVNPASSTDIHTASVPATTTNVLIVANPGSISAPTVGTAYDKVMLTPLTLSKTLTLSALTADNKFMMTNASGTLEPYYSKATATTDAATAQKRQVGKFTLYDTEAEARSHAPVSIHVDRVVAKVKTSVSADPSDNSSEEVHVTFTTEGAKYAMTVTNTKFYYSSARVQGDIGSVGTNANDIYKWGSWRVDPNYSGQHAAWGAAGTGTDEKMGELEDNYNVIKEDASADWKALETASYCLENTQDKVDNYQGFITHSLMKIQVWPKESQGEGFKQGEDWLSINDTFYTWQSLYEAYAASKKESGGSAGISQTIFESIFTKLKGDTFNGQVVSDGKSLKSAIFPEDQSMGKTVSVESDKEYVCNYYYKSWNYYMIPVKHDYAAQGDGKKTGSYGVVRNSSYNIDVTAIKHPGTGGIITPDPDKPIEDDSNYLAVKIEVNQWAVYNQNEQL